MPLGSQSTPGATVSGRVRKYLADEWNEERESLRSIYGNRSIGWWFGGAVGFGLFVFITARLRINLRYMSLVGVLLGGAAGNWIWTYLRQNLTEDRSRRDRPRYTLRP